MASYDRKAINSKARAIMPLTDVAIRAAKAAEGKVLKLLDGGGFQLWIKPTGAKLWCFAYRFDGKQKKLSIGTYPPIDLRVARARREEAKGLLRDGRTLRPKSVATSL